MGSCSLNRFVIFHKNVIMRITEKANIYAFILPALVIPANTIASQKYVALRMSRQMYTNRPHRKAGVQVTLTVVPAIGVPGY